MPTQERDCPSCGRELKGGTCPECGPVDNTEDDTSPDDDASSSDDDLIEE